MAYGGYNNEYIEYGPFRVLDINEIEQSWFRALLAAYNNNAMELNIDLKNLDREVAYSDRFGNLNPGLQSIWEWTWATPWKNIQVMIVGNQPSSQVLGSGLAFHPFNGGEVSTSLRNIFDQVAMEFDLSDPHEDGDFSLDGWINQGVVLVNAMTTKDSRRNVREHSSWLPIMKRLLDYVYDRKAHVQFILVGGRTREEFLTERFQQMSMNNRIQLAHHPCYGYQGSDPRFVPFGTALMNCNARVDWTNLKMWNNYYY